LAVRVLSRRLIYIAQEVQEQDNLSLATTAQELEGTIG